MGIPNLSTNTQNNIARNHHYVWQYYLRPWAQNNSKHKATLIESGNECQSYRKIVCFNKNNVSLFNQNGCKIDISDNKELVQRLCNVSNNKELEIELHKNLSYLINQGLYADNGQMFCFNKNTNQVFPSHTKTIVTEKDFYKVNQLTSEDLFYIKSMAFSNKNIPCEALTKWNDVYETIFALQKLFNHFHPKDSESKQLKHVLQKTECELVEKMHTLIEIKGSKYIDLIRVQDINFVQNEESRLEFLFFLSVQYVRTEKIKTSISSMITRNQENDKAIIEIFKNSVNTISDTISRHYNLIAFNYAWFYAYELINYKITLLKNSTDINFITCDQPVVNTDSMNENIGIKKLEIYYPITPKLAILVSKETQPIQHIPVVKQLNIDEVTYYNDLILYIASQYIFASSCNQIE